MANRRVDKITIEKRWLTAPQLKEYLGFGNRGTQQEWRDKGLLPYYRIGRVIVYDKKDVDDFVANYKQEVQDEEFRTRMSGRVLG